jgi:hypothetical protein
LRRAAPAPPTLPSRQQEEEHMRRRMLAARVSAVAIVALACLPVGAQIYKCPVGSGYSLQQSPCAGLGQSGGRLLVLPNGHTAPVAVPISASGSASGSASDVPKLGRVLGRTPLPSSEVAGKPN